MQLWEVEQGKIRKTENRKNGKTEKKKLTPKNPHNPWTVAFHHASTFRSISCGGLFPNAAAPGTTRLFPNMRLQISHISPG